VKYEILNLAVLEFMQPVTQKKKSYNHV